MARAASILAFPRVKQAAHGPVLLRAALAALSRCFPSLCGRCTEALFRLPPRQRCTRREVKTLRTARHEVLRYRPGVELAYWKWGRGPRVFLVHGWGGHAGRLAGFVGPLVEAGFSVVGFDAPGHGSSRGGRLASLPDFVEAIAALAGLEPPAAFVGHSMGAAACALAIRGGLPAEAAVLLAPPENPEKYTRRFVRFLRVPPVVGRSMTERLERRYDLRLRDLRLSTVALDVPALIFHDSGDRRVPIGDGLAIASAWSRARLVPTRGLGHHKILRDPGVIAQAVQFLRDAMDRSVSAATIGASA